MSAPSLALALSLLAGAAVAQDFSEGSDAREWGLYGESKAFFAATVVDPLCELTGDCPDNCGDGARQLALLREADGVMVLPLKNGQPAFTGGANELLPFCGQAVEVDGLLITDAELGAQNVYLVQTIRAEGASEWIKANRWTKDWAAANPDAAGQGPWFRRDPRIAAEIAREGWLGLGPEEDAAFLKEWFQ
ncbi:hypothetical protein [Oceanibium sediminis]|uniref:hypothetical protein n=1 Tax=Oceanibium sediminis TaxID=2026339 RepID=UPI000DD3C407|nr:hypothetical protein [Oceanibium sediminis]